jgi:riboflavin biosynthesis protein RibD
MLRAVELALNWPHTHPNPRVGSVVTDASGEVVGEGWHRGPGTDHAEVMALQRAGEAARGGTTYATLEPCTHHGHTPPCVEALIEAGVATVVIGAIDPDDRVNGQGVIRLKEAGIEVISGVEQAKARSVDLAYFHYHETGLPRVTLKYAMTLDGAAAADDGTSKWITGEAARRDVHRLRSLVDAVVIAAGTLREDDPSLDVRLDGYIGPQPRAVVVAGKTPLPVRARLWRRDPIIVSTGPREAPSGEVIEVKPQGEHPDPVETCRLWPPRACSIFCWKGARRSLGPGGVREWSPMGWSTSAPRSEGAPERLRCPACSALSPRHPMWNLKTSAALEVTPPLPSARKEFDVHRNNRTDRNRRRGQRQRGRTSGRPRRPRHRRPPDGSFDRCERRVPHRRRHRSRTRSRSTSSRNRYTDRTSDPWSESPR